MKRGKLTLLLGLISIQLLFWACASKPAPVQPGVEPAPVPGKGPDKAAAKEAWEIEWDKTVEVAKKEGRVVVYASSVAPALKEAVNIVKQKFGLNLDIVSGRGTELRGRLIQERKSGIYLADIVISGPNSVFGDVKALGFTDRLEPALILPEVLNPKLWHEGKLPFLDENRHAFAMYAYPNPPLAINTSMVKPGEIRSYKDLIEPKWKGKILLNDPTVTGTAFNSFSSLLFGKVVDLDYFRQLVKQEPLLMRDQRLHVDWAARGKYPLALFARTLHVSEYQKAGSPLEWVSPEEGIDLSVDGGVVVLVNRAPHPNGAKVLINWMLSREGQIIMQEVLLQQSAREDIPSEKIGLKDVRKPGQKYIFSVNTNEKWVLTEQDKYLDMAKQIFDPLLK